MRVELASLDGKTCRFAHDYGPGELALDDERVAIAVPPEVSGRITRAERKVVVEGKLVAVAKVECDRCLGPVTVPINTEFSVEYVTLETYRTTEIAELGEEDLALSVFEGEFIDVDEILREQLLLAVPTHVICREDCKGLCPMCGEDRNLSNCDCKTTEIDPRWAGLEELVNGK